MRYLGGGERTGRVRGRWRVLASAVVALALAACARDSADAYRPVPGGDAKRGKLAIQNFGCAYCHVIPGIRNGEGTVGPPLTAFARRVYIAGEAPNTVDNLIRWLENPQAIEPGTAMPNLGVIEPIARDMAAYLYTLH
jgi:cytochrome c